jgi:carbonyl reductase 1
VAVVTGSNKGIGLQIVRDIAKQGVTTVMTSRDLGRGQQAVEGLRAEGLNTVVLYPGSLEVTSQESVNKFAAWLKSEFSGIDILVSFPSATTQKHQ